MAGSVTPNYIEEYTAKASPAKAWTALDEQGAAIDLTSAVITGWLLSLVDNSVTRLQGAFTLANQSASRGQFSYQWTLIDVSGPGIWSMYFSAKLPGDSYARELGTVHFVVLPTPEWINNMTIQEVDLNVGGAPNMSGNPAFVQLVASIVTHVIVDQLPALVLAASSANIGKVTPQVASADVATSNPLPTTSGQVGEVVPWGTNPSTTGIATDAAFKFGASGNTTVQRFCISNETGSDVRYELDASATANSLRLKDGNIIFIQQPTAAIHLFTAASQSINAAGGVMIRGWN